MNVIYSTDENYAKICMTSIWSLLDSNKCVEEIKIYIIDNQITENTKKEMKDLIENKYQREIIFISCEEICRDLEKNNDYPISSYARLFIQDFIKEEKIIYVDCDTLVRGNLENLWNCKLKEYLVGGIQDPLPDYLKEAVQLDNQERYINAGVLLINLDKWREIDFKSKVVKFIKEHNKNVVHHDQGIINGICKGKILYLDPKYNLMSEMIMMNEKQLKKLYKMEKFYKEEQLQKARENPVIVHFISKFYNRPWFKECTHPYKDEFLSYYKKVNGEIKSKPLNRKVKMRKFAFEHFPFNIYVSVERMLNYKRKNQI